MDSQDNYSILKHNEKTLRGLFVLLFPIPTIAPNMDFWYTTESNVIANFKKRSRVNENCDRNG